MGIQSNVSDMYDRDEVTPSIETAMKQASFLDTTVDCLLGETEDGDLPNDHDMFSRQKDINDFSS